MGDSLRRQAETAFRAGLEQIDPRRLIEGKIRLDGGTLHAAGREISLDGLDSIRVVAFGKAACRMAGALDGALAGGIAEGVVLSNSFPEELPNKYRTFECTHPLPSARNVAATEEALDLAHRAGERDLVICLVSGGGSAILTAPAPGISLEELSETIRLLLQAGAPISQLNAVRIPDGRHPRPKRVGSDCPPGIRSNRTESEARSHRARSRACPSQGCRPGR